MDSTITNLELITKEKMNDNNLLFIQDVSETETKNVVVSDLTKYIISSSNILTSLRTGSFTGSFFGLASGSIFTSSYSSTSSYSNLTFFLNYSPITDNGSSSYSIQSLSSSLSNTSSLNITSSLSNTSSYSDKTSYVDILTSNTSSTSLFSLNSNLSSYSSTSLFLNYNGIDNGTCLHSIISEQSKFSIISKNLPNNNTSTSSLAISSSHSLFSEKSFYIQNTDYSKVSSKSIYTSKNVYAFINFQVTGINKYDIYSWKNINTSTPIKWKQNGALGQFFIYFDLPLSVGSLTTVVSDWNFETSKWVKPNTLFKSYSYPNKHYGMVVGVWSINVYPVEDFFGTTHTEWNPKNPSDLLIGSTFSVVAYKSIQKYPKKVSLLYTDTLVQVGGCAAL